MLQANVIQNTTALGNLLRKSRKDLGATQQKLAELHGVSRYTIVDAESGEGDPKFSTVMTLLSGLGISLVAVPSYLAHRVTVPERLSLDEEDLDVDNWDSEEELSI